MSVKFLKQSNPGKKVRARSLLPMLFVLNLRGKNLTGEGGNMANYGKKKGAGKGKGRKGGGRRNIKRSPCPSGGPGYGKGKGRGKGKNRRK